MTLHCLSENFSTHQFGMQRQDMFGWQKTTHPRTCAGTIGLFCADHNLLQIFQPIVQFISASTFLL